MSTVDTHINWGVSYLVNDLYRRFLRPGASQRELVRVSRIGVVGLAMLAVVIAAQISSIEKAWRVFIALGAGLGLPAILRWLWWRVNAWTEIAGMVTAVAASLALYALFPDTRDEYLLVAIVALATTASLIATFVTEPVPRDRLEEFVARVRPPGWWNGIPGSATRRSTTWTGAAFVAGNIGVFALLFGGGHALLGRLWLGVVLVVLGGAALVITVKALARARERALTEPHAAGAPAGRGS